ncbi:SRPBCC family protein [Amycolatopsis sp. Hca4]|uniref:SRPBCC family protein n=1 Tax=Amycolatopsis sp. Hca4 TaxID=2742131 RepID=UPI0015926884|nr:SRPBCC family protein [Amycolatopsis sp. Hca4]QKV75803.1 SRPBCC family protein [Amycolatopsis sp. Hca4]
MELVHDFTVPVPADEAWEVLTDVQRIVTCMPGASVTKVDGDAFEGGMKIKLGPIGMNFTGQGTFLEKDADAKTAVIQAKGRDAKGNGGAQATVTAALSGSNGTTSVHVVTDLNVSGKAGQFGGGVLKDVSNRMLTQFADNLAAQLTSDGQRTEPAPTPDAAARTAAPAAAAASGPEDSGLDLGALLFGSESTRRTAKTAGALIAGIAFGFLWGKTRVLERQLRNA